MNDNDEQTTTAPALTPEQQQAARLEELNAKRAAKLEQSAAARAKANLPVAIADAEALAAAEEEHGESYRLGDEYEPHHKLVVVDTPLGDLIFKRPATVVHKKYLAASAAGKNGVPTHEQKFEYAFACLADQVRDKARFTAAIDGWPGCLDRFVHGCAELAGVKFKELLGK